MAVFIGLLRGVNVGGHGKIKMEALRAACSAAGFTGATTHLQSGNVVFASRSADRERVAKRLAASIVEACGVVTEVILRTPAEMQDVVTRNPFAKREGLNPSWLLVMFLASDPDPDASATLVAKHTGPEEIHVSGRELFLYYGTGIGPSKLTSVVLERRLGTRGTARNWNTVGALLGIAAEVS